MQVRPVRIKIHLNELRTWGQGGTYSTLRQRYSQALCTLRYFGYPCCPLTLTWKCRPIGVFSNTSVFFTATELKLIPYQSVSYLALCRLAGAEHVAKPSSNQRAVSWSNSQNSQWGIIWPYSCEVAHWWIPPTSHWDVSDCTGGSLTMHLTLCGIFIPT